MAQWTTHQATQQTGPGRQGPGGPGPVGQGGQGRQAPLSWAALAAAKPVAPRAAAAVPLTTEQDLLESLFSGGGTSKAARTREVNKALQRVLTGGAASSSVSKGNTVEDATVAYLEHDSVEYLGLNTGTAGLVGRQFGVDLESLDRHLDAVKEFGSAQKIVHEKNFGCAEMVAVAQYLKKDPKRVLRPGVLEGSRITTYFVDSSAVKEPCGGCEAMMKRLKIVPAQD